MNPTKVQSARSVDRHVSTMDSVSGAGRVTMSKSKQIGTLWERTVVEYLREHGFPYAERRALAGVNDKGDIAGCLGIMWECKAEKQIRLSAYMDEVRVQTANADAVVGAAVVKRRQHNVERAYVVMELCDFVKLVAE